MVAWKEAAFAQQDTLHYWRALRQLILRDVADGVTQVGVGIDGGGGFGGGIIDLLGGDVELLNTVPDLTVWEVHFGAGGCDHMQGGGHAGFLTSVGIPKTCRAYGGRRGPAPRSPRLLIQCAPADK
jgi:hypothetical protein